MIQGDDEGPLERSFKWGQFSKPKRLEMDVISSPAAHSVQDMLMGLTGKERTLKEASDSQTADG